MLGRTHCVRPAKGNSAEYRGAAIAPLFLGPLGKSAKARYPAEIHRRPAGRGPSAPLRGRLDPVVPRVPTGHSPVTTRARLPHAAPLLFPARLSETRLPVWHPSQIRPYWPNLRPGGQDVPFSSRKPFLTT